MLREVAGYHPSTDGKGKRHNAEVVLLNKDEGELTGGARFVMH